LAFGFYLRLEAWLCHYWIYPDGGHGPHLSPPFCALHCNALRTGDRGAGRSIAIQKMPRPPRGSLTSYRRGIIEGGSVNRCFKTPVIIANTGYRKGLSRKLGCGKSRLSSYIFPRAVEIGRRLLPIFRTSLFEKLFRPGNTYLPSPPLHGDSDTPACNYLLSSTRR
jgi:hypothetical protein